MLHDGKCEVTHLRTQDGRSSKTVPSGVGGGDGLISLPQRGRGTTVGFPEASEVELWGFSLVVDEEIPIKF